MTSVQPAVLHWNQLRLHTLASNPPLVWRVSFKAQERAQFALIPGTFDYLVARNVDEAVALLDRHGGDAKILAGGQSLIPLIRFRIAGPTVLIDINRIDSLEYIQETDGTLHNSEVYKDIRT